MAQVFVLQGDVQKDNQSHVFPLRYRRGGMGYQIIK